MGKGYPEFRSSYSHEELVEHFLLTPVELQLVLTCRGDVNRCGMALLLKTLSHLGYVPDTKPHIPREVRSLIAGQLGLLWDCSEAYTWYGSTRDYHLTQIRQHIGWRFSTAQDKDDLENWLRTHGAIEAHTIEAFSVPWPDQPLWTVRIGLGETFISGGSMTRPQFVDSLIGSYRSFPCVAPC